MSGFDRAAKGSKATVNPVGGFAAAAASRSQEDMGGGYQASASGYGAVVERLERELRDFVQNVTSLRRLAAQVGTKQDNMQLRQRCEAAIKRAGDISKAFAPQVRDQLQPLVREAGLSAREQTARKAAESKFMEDYKAALQAFNDAFTSYQAAVKRYGPAPAGREDSGSAAAAAAAAGGAGSSKAGMSRSEEEQFMAGLQQVDLTTSLLTEREQNIDDIARQVGEVNEIFKDLNTMVAQQGEMLDKVEVNVGEAHAQTEAGVAHLTKAAEYQSRYRKCIIIFALIILLAAGGITAYFVLTKKNSN